MKDTEGRRVEAAGDAARIWHALDKVLRDLCESRSDLENAGFEDLAECLHGPIERVKVRYDGAEGEVARLLDGGPGVGVTALLKGPGELPVRDETEG